VTHGGRAGARAAARAAIVGAGMMLLAGCGSSPSSLDRAGSESDRVATVWWLAFGVASAVYLIVAGLVVYGALRRGDAKFDAPRERREQWVIAIGGVLIPFLILLFFAFVTVNTTAHLRGAAPKTAVDIEVRGERWFWAVDYPKLGIKTANEIHVPVGRTIHFRLTSDNVIHSFWVPQIAGKEDMIPGQPNDLTVTVKKPGRYRGLCAEYCGIEHARMQFIVFADDPVTFGRWVAQRQQQSTMPTSDQAAAGERVFMREACAGCHTIRDTPADGTIGPDLTDVGSRSTIGSGILDNTPKNLKEWIAHTQQVKPGSLMPTIPLSSHDVDAIVAYLQHLG
jgi:cytochrome c oxidase subunit 2